MEFQTSVVKTELSITEDGKKIYMFADKNGIYVYLDGQYMYELSFTKLYNLLNAKNTSVFVLNSELTTKNNLINKLTDERDTLEKELQTYKNLVNHLKCEIDQVGTEKINIGKVYIPGHYNKPYCLLRDNGMYLCTDNICRKAGLPDPDKHLYYHETYNKLIELLDKHYIYELEK